MLCVNKLSLMLVMDLLLQGFYYDGFYGELGLSDNHFPSIEAGAAKAAKVLFLLFDSITFKVSYNVCYKIFAYFVKPF